MKKFLVPIISGAVGIIIPVAGMTITPTRNLILGLAPEEAVLQLADKIDENGINFDTKMIENEQQIRELQQTISDQRDKISEQEILINNQNSKISTTATEIQAVKNSTVNETECRKLYQEHKYCESKNYRDKSDFDKYIDERKEVEDDLKIKFDYSESKNKFEICQEIIKKCG